MQTTLIIINVVLGLALSISILLQEKGNGFGEAIGGTGGGGGFQTTKRGAELVLAKSSIVLFVLFLSVSLVLNFL
ncbi:MAG: protein translocase SecG subunit [Oceanicoccus sp.]|jgi:protein translocase SecG subunit